MKFYIFEIERERETIRENYGKLEKIQRGTIHTLSQIAEMREQIRKGHQQRVCIGIFILFMGVTGWHKIPLRKGNNPHIPLKKGGQRGL